MAQTAAICIAIIGSIIAAAAGHATMAKELLTGIATLIDALTFQWVVALTVLGVSVVQRTKEKTGGEGRMIGSLLDMLPLGRRGAEMQAALYILAETLLGRASGGWCPGGWVPPWDMLYRKLWALSIGSGVALYQPVPWWIGVPVVPLAYWSRAKQSQPLKECWTVKGMPKMGLIGVLQVAAVVGPVAAYTLDPWPLLWCAAGLLRGVAYYLTRRWLARWVGPFRSLVGYPIAAAELAWYGGAWDNRGTAAGAP